MTEARAALDLDRIAVPDDPTPAPRSTRGSSFTVRLPVDLYVASEGLARAREMSLNALVEQALTRLLRTEEERALYEAFGRIGDDTAVADVDFAFEAQAEVISKERSRGRRRSSSR